MSKFCIYLVTATALFLASCDDGGGGPPVRLFFGMENRGECSSIEIEVQLSFAGTEIMRRTDGSLDCDLDSLLAAEGCQAQFSTTADDASLVVRITGCDVFEASLFHCLFRNPDLARLNTGTHGDCTCAHVLECNPAHATCYRDPGICVTENPTGRGCEHCSNDLDDDGDGRIDCDDDKCLLACGVGLTTTTCSTSTSVTVATMPPSTTLLAND